MAGMYEELYCYGGIGGALAAFACSGYIQHVNNWEMNQVGWVGKRLRMLMSTYKGRDSPEEMEEFAKKARKDLRIDKEKALVDGVLIPKKSRKKLYDFWNRLQGHLAQDSPAEAYAWMMEIYGGLEKKDLTDMQADQYVPDLKLK